MTLEDLIAQFRLDADDRVASPLWSDEAVAGWFTEAVAEAAIRSRLIHESSNPAVCQIPVTIGASTYPLHKALHEIDYIAFKRTGATTSEPIKLMSREMMDKREPGWRDRTGCVRYAIQNDTSIRLAFTPDVTGTIFIEGYRVPLNPLENDSDTPEIHTSHHRKLVHWALFRAFSVPDSETVDKDRAEKAERTFESYFGIRYDSDMHREFTHDTPHRNEVFWP